MSQIFLQVMMVFTLGIYAYAADPGPKSDTPTRFSQSARQTSGVAATDTPKAAPSVALANAPIVQPLTPKVLKTNRTFTITMFVIMIAISVVILAWSARKNKTAADYYAAGGKITGFQNGWAIAGDTLSAATFLGTTGLISLFGGDGFMYAVGPMVAFITILLIIAEPCRNAGKYTLGDILSFRSPSKLVRGASAISAVVISAFYLLVQMVGAGKLMQLLLGISYQAAVIGVGMLIVVYVSYGGMRATTWVQIIKAALLVGMAVVLGSIVLFKSDMNPLRLMNDVASSAAVQDHVRTLLKHGVAENGFDYGQRFLEMGLFLKDPLDQISLGIAMILGVAGLPHIMMRFFTVPNAKEARKSIVLATVLVVVFMSMVVILGLGAAIYVTPQQVMGVDKGGNLAALMMAQYIGGGPGTIGGDLLLAFLCAVAFATILAVVSGLVLASSAAIAHDMYVTIFKDGKADQGTQVKVARIASLVVGIIATLLAVACERQNVIVLASLAFAVSASSNFPVILFALFWKRFNTAGIASGLIVGAVVTIGLVMVSPNMTYPKVVAAGAKKIVDTLEKKQMEGASLSDKDLKTLQKARVDYALNKDGKSIMGLNTPLFPLKNPAIVSVPIGFLVTIFATLLFQNKRDEEMFDELHVRQNTGLGIAKMAEH